MGLADQSTGFIAANDLTDRRSHKLKRLPVTARGQRIAALPVGVMIVRVAVARTYLVDQLRRDAVALDRQRVTGIVLIDNVSPGSASGLDEISPPFITSRRKPFLTSRWR